MRHRQPPAGLKKKNKKIKLHPVTQQQPMMQKNPHKMQFVDLNSLKSSALSHCLQLAGGAVGQSFPQIENLDHRQDAEFFGQTGAP